jgi:hypothetical protein
VSGGETIEFELIGRDAAKVLSPCLTALGVSHTVYRGDGFGDRIVVRVGPREDQLLLKLWDELTRLRVAYLAARESENVIQLSFLDGHDEVMLL